MTNRIRLLLPWAVGPAVILLPGCTLPSSEPMIPQAQVGVAATISQGRILATETVTIEGDRTSLGTVSGAAVGGAAGSGGRYDTTGIIAGAVGAAAGAVVGQAVEEVATREPGQRLTILMDDGTVIEVVQEVTDGYYREGDRVNVAMGVGNTRVSLSTGMDTSGAEASAPVPWYEIDHGAPFAQSQNARR